MVEICARAEAEGDAGGWLLSMFEDGAFASFPRLLSLLLSSILALCARLVKR